MHVSEKGEALAMHARQILRINDLALGLFDRYDNTDQLRIGLPLDYGVRLLQQNLTGLMQEHETLALNIQCELSATLYEALLRDEVDIIVALYQGGDPQYLVRHWTEQPFWVGSDTIQPNASGDLPLVAHPAGCVYRQRMTDSLKSVQRGWNVVFSSPSIEAVQQAVHDGLGFSCLTSPTSQKGLRRIGHQEGLPPLEPLSIGLFYRQTRLGSWGNLVAECLTSTIDGGLKETSN